MRRSLPLDLHRTIEHGGAQSRLLNIPRYQERVSGKQRGSGIDGGQDLTSHGRGPMSSKPSFPSEEPGSRILRGYYGAKELSNLGPLYTRPKAHAKEGKMPEDARRKPKRSRDDAKDDLVLDTPDPRRKDEHRRTHTGVWCESNSRRSYHLHIECTQLTFWSH